MKLHVGQSVDVKVQSVFIFGLFCAYDGDTELLVRLPELSWIASFCSCAQFADVGDTVTVKIHHIEASSGHISASLRRRFPDPWTTEALKVGRVHAANIVRHVRHADRCHDGPGYMLELVPGAFVMLCTSETNLMPGTTCDVIITTVNPQIHAVTVALVKAS